MFSFETCSSHDVHLFHSCRCVFHAFDTALRFVSCSPFALLRPMTALRVKTPVLKRPAAAAPAMVMKRPAAAAAVLKKPAADPSVQGKVVGKYKVVWEPGETRDRRTFISLHFHRVKLELERAHAKPADVKATCAHVSAKARDLWDKHFK